MKKLFSNNYPNKNIILYVYDLMSYSNKEYNSINIFYIMECSKLNYQKTFIIRNIILNHELFL